MLPAFLSPGEGETITDRPERWVQLKAALDVVSVTESRYGPHEQGPEPHIHRRHADVFYVLEGELVFRLGPDGEPRRAPAGTLVVVPPNTIHSFSNEGPGDTRFLNVHAPDADFAASLRGETEQWDSFDV